MRCMSFPYPSMWFFKVVFVYLFIFTYATTMPIFNHNGMLAYGKQKEANFNWKLSRLNNGYKTGLKPGGFHTF